jgi:hypothetical protein
VALVEDNLGRTLIQDTLAVGSLSEQRNRDRAISWLRVRLNEFVNVLRPRVKAAVADMDEDAR